MFSGNTGDLQSYGHTREFHLTLPVQVKADLDLDNYRYVFTTKPLINYETELLRYTSTSYTCKANINDVVKPLTSLKTYTPTSPKQQTYVSQAFNNNLLYLHFILKTSNFFSEKI